MLLATTREKPSARASAAVSIGVVGARDGARSERQRVGFRRGRAPAGRGRAAARRRARAGSARRAPAARAAGGCRPASARRPPPLGQRGERGDQATRAPAAARPIRRRRYSRRSSDTCSLRERPVCSRLAGVPDALDELPLDERVHVLVRAATNAGSAWPALEDFGQRRRRWRARVRGDSTPALRQRLGPRQAPVHIVFEQAAVEAERGSRTRNRGVGRRCRTGRTREWTCAVPSRVECRTQRAAACGGLDGEPPDRMKPSAPAVERSPSAASSAVVARIGDSVRRRGSRPGTASGERAGHALLHVRDERVDRLARRREPQAVVHQVGVRWRRAPRQSLEVARVTSARSSRCAACSTTAAGAS